MHNHPYLTWCSYHYVHFVWLLILSGMLSLGRASAAAPQADTEIINVATVGYTIDDKDYDTEATATFRIAQLLDLSLICQTAPLDVVPGEVNVVSTYFLTNVGNGPDTFELTLDNSQTGSDEFDPLLVSIWLDDGDGIFQGAGSDTLYVFGSNDPQLDSGDELLIFVLNDMPLGLVDGDEGVSVLSAASVLQSSPLDPISTRYSGQGFGGVDAIVGNTQAAGTAECIHRVLSIAVTLVKTNEILAAYNTDTILPGEVLDEAVPGAVVTYTLTATAAGMGIAESVSITDALPAGTAYFTGNFTLDGAPLTELADSDDGEVVSGELTVRLPDMQNGDSYTVTFNALIQ